MDAHSLLIVQNNCKLEHVYEENTFLNGMLL